MTRTSPRMKSGEHCGALRERITLGQIAYIAGRLHSYCRPAQFILPFDSKPRSGHCRAQRTRRVSAVNSPPTETIPSGILSESRLLPATDRRRKLAAGTPLCEHLHCARQPFRRCPRQVHFRHPNAVPGTTREHANGTTTALQQLRRASARSYLGHTPPLRLLKHRADQARHRATKRGSHSGSCVSPSLHLMGHVAIQCYPEDTAAVCPRLPARHSFQAAVKRLDFGEQNVEALPYPSATGFCGSAPSPMRLTGKPFISRAFRG